MAVHTDATRAIFEGRYREAIDLLEGSDAKALRKIARKRARGVKLTLRERLDLMKAYRAAGLL